MKRLRLSDTIDLYFPPSEVDSAELVRTAFTRSRPLIRELWGLDDPPRCRIYVMTSWLTFVFHSAPWYARLPFLLSLPLWCWRVRRMWPLCAGWTQRYRRRPAIGVKPLKLMESADRGVGKLIFLDGFDLRKKVELTLCHELTHAYSAHLALPLWLNEGIAMLSVDRYFGEATVNPRTVDGFATSVRPERPGTYRTLPVLTHADMARHYTRGYWITRFLEESHPGLLLTLLQRRHRARELEGAIATALGSGPRDFWRSIDPLVAAHFALRPPAKEVTLIASEDSEEAPPPRS